MIQCLRKQVLELDFMEDLKEMLPVDLIHQIFQDLLHLDLEAEEPSKKVFSHTSTYMKIISVRKERE